MTVPLSARSASSAATAAPTDGSHWRAWHLHLASDARSVQDRVVVDVVLPVVRDLAGPWFFVRYWQGGPHIRVRVRDLDGEAAARVERQLRERLATAGRLRDGEVVRTPAEHAHAVRLLLGAGEPGSGDDQVLLPAGVHLRPYEPEVERYGGEALLPSAEQLFCVSSEVSARALLGVPSTGARAGLALQAAVAAAAALRQGPERRAFAGLGLEAWRDFVAGLGVPASELDRVCDPVGGPGGAGGPVVAWDRLAGVDGPLRPFALAVRQHVALARSATDQEPGRLLFSHVHMLHNRLGLQPVHEVQTYSRLVRLVRQADST